MPDDIISPGDFMRPAGGEQPPAGVLSPQQFMGLADTPRLQMQGRMPSPFEGGTGPLGIPGIPRIVQQGGSALARGATEAAGALGDVFDWTDRQLQGPYGQLWADNMRRLTNAGRQAVGADPLLMPPRGNQEDVAASGPVRFPAPSVPQTELPVGVPRSAIRPLGVPNTEELQAPLRRLGVIDNPNLAVNQNSPVERYTDRAMEMAGASFPFGARGMVSGGISGLADRGAEDLGLGAGGRLAASLLGGIFGNFAYSGGERIANAVAGRMTPAGQAYVTAGMTPRMVGDVSGSPMMQTLQNAAARMPGGMARMERAAQRTLDDFTAAVDNAANNYGNARTPEQAGEALQAGARSWMDRWRQGSETAWNRVLSVLPEDQPMRVDNLRAAVADVGQRMNDVPQVAAVLRSDRFTALRRAIEASPEEWRSQSVRTMRTIIGQLNEARGLVGDIFTRELDQLYGALSDDLRAAVAMRPGGLQAWEEANAITRQGHAIVDRVVTPLIREGATPTDAWNFATSQISARSGGGTRIGDVANITGAGNEVAAARISQQGQRVMESRSPAAFSQLTDPRSARGLAPEAADVLFGQPGSRDRNVLAALDQIARQARATNRFFNNSGTAGQAAMTGYLGGTLPAAAGAVGGAAMGAVPWSVAGPAVGAAVGLPVAGYLSSLLATSPTVARLAAAQSTGPTMRQGILNQLIQQDLARQHGLIGGP